jgi:hypothetical protein
MIRLVLVLLFVATPALAQDAGLEAWSKIHEVFSHPRCANCHVGDDRVPMWSGRSYGPKPRPHGMNINGGTSRSGDESIPCTSCHTKHNSSVPHGPPGADPDEKGWRLAPVSMQWFGKSSAEICEQVKDESRNGGRNIAKLVEHIKDEKLVQWGWKPGLGDLSPEDRAPREREIPRYSREQVIEFLEKWGAAGTPCPTK